MADTKKFITVCNWDSFQHYKQGRGVPPWIKLYTRLIDQDSIEYSMLADVEKLHLHHLWLLASKHENKIPLIPDWLQRRLNITEPLNLEPLVNGGFLKIVDEDDKPAELDATPDAPKKQNEKPERNPAIGESQVEPWFNDQFWPKYSEGCKAHQRRAGSKKQALDQAKKHCKDVDTRYAIIDYLDRWLEFDRRRMADGDFAEAWPDAFRWIWNHGWRDELPQSPGTRPRPKKCSEPRCQMERLAEGEYCSYHNDVKSGHVLPGVQHFWSRWYHANGDAQHPVRLWGRLGGQEADMERIIADERKLGLPPTN